MSETTPESVKPVLADSSVTSSGSVQFMTPAASRSEWCPVSTGPDADGAGRRARGQLRRREIERVDHVRLEELAALRPVARSSARPSST